MSKRKKRHKPSSSRDFGRQPRRMIGMVSVKTILHRNGFVIIRQGERISEEVILKFEHDEVIEEILANAMPSGK